MNISKNIDELLVSPKMYLLIFIVGFLSYMFFSQAMPITDPVESNYALTAKEMVLSKDWLSPRIYGQVWFDKPIFFYWLTALSFEVFGISEGAARLVPALFAAFGLVMIYLFTIKVTKPLTALLTVLIMGTAFEYMVLAKLVITDMVFFVFNCMALLFFYLGYQAVTKRKLYYLLMYASLALAVLTKGPIGVFLPGLVMLLFVVSQKAWKNLLPLFSLQGIILFLVLVVPWYGVMYVLYGNDFINTFLGVHNYLRATVSEHPKDNVFYYYFAIFVISMLPWTALTVKAMWVNWWDRRQAISPVMIFLYIWVSTYFVFYTLMATKYPTYIFPIVFPLSIITAVYLEKILMQNKKAELWCWVGLPLVLFIFINIGANYHYLTGWQSFVSIGSLLVLAILGLLQVKNKTAIGLLKVLGLCQLGSYLILSMFTLPAITEDRTGKDLASNISVLEQTDIGMYEFYSTSAVFYSNKLAIQVDKTASIQGQTASTKDWSKKYTMPKQDLVGFLDSDGVMMHLVVVEDKKKAEFLQDAIRLDYKLLKNSNGLSYYVIEKQ